MTYFYGYTSAESDMLKIIYSTNWLAQMKVATCYDSLGKDMRL